MHYLPPGVFCYLRHLCIGKMRLINKTNITPNPYKAGGGIHIDKQDRREIKNKDTKYYIYVSKSILVHKTSQAFLHAPVRMHVYWLTSTRQNRLNV